MFHLWPEPVPAGLFPDRAWLGQAKAMLETRPASAGQRGAIEAFDQLLELAGETIRGRRQIRLTVSDAFARVIVLPWQETLTRRAELDAYALAQFERIGQRLDDQWVMVSYYRRFGAAGLAYALPGSLLEQLRDIAAARNVTLGAIMPASAVAYAYQPGGRGSRQTALLIQESGRVTAMVSGAKGLCTHAVEPCTSKTAATAERLLRRVCGQHEIASVAMWPLCADECDTAALVSRFLPGAPYAQLSLNAWS